MQCCYGTAVTARGALGPELLLTHLHLWASCEEQRFQLQALEALWLSWIGFVCSH